MNGWSSLVRHTTILFLLLAVGVALVLFSVKYQVQDLEEQLSRLNQEIDAEHQTVHVLRAEFSYLTNAERLRKLSDRHLDLVPVKPEQVATFASLPLTKFGEDGADREAAGAEPVRAATVGEVVR